MGSSRSSCEELMVGVLSQQQTYRQLTRKHSWTTAVSHLQIIILSRFWICSVFILEKYNQKSQYEKTLTILPQLNAQRKWWRCLQLQKNKSNSGRLVKQLQGNLIFKKSSYYSWKIYLLSVCEVSLKVAFLSQSLIYVWLCKYCVIPCQYKTAK